MSNYASMTGGSAAGVVVCIFAKQLAQTGGSAILDRRALVLSNGKTGTEFQVEDTDGKVVATARSAGAPAAAGTASNEQMERETPSKRRKKEHAGLDIFGPSHQLGQRDDGLRPPQRSTRVAHAQTTLDTRTLFHKVDHVPSSLTCITRPLGWRRGLGRSLNLIVQNQTH